MTSPAHPRVATVARLLAEAGASGEVRVLPAEVRTAAAAAAALDVPVGAIVNSLVFDAAGSPLLILTSGAHRVDEAKVAALLGVPRDTRPRPTSSASTPARPSAASPRSATPSRSAPSSTSSSPATTSSGPPPGTRRRSSRPATRSCSG